MCDLHLPVRLIFPRLAGQCALEADRAGSGAVQRRITPVPRVTGQATCFRSALPGCIFCRASPTHQPLVVGEPLGRIEYHRLFARLRSPSRISKLFPGPARTSNFLCLNKLQRIFHILQRGVTLKQSTV